MKFIYIQNYLTLSREEKREFFALIGTKKEFRITNQKIILNDNSLILELDTNSNVSLAKKFIEDFFKKESKISVKIVNNIIQNDTKIVLDFEDTKSKEVML
jgi:hypothetical protein